MKISAPVQRRQTGQTEKLYYTGNITHKGSLKPILRTRFPAQLTLA